MGRGRPAVFPLLVALSLPVVLGRTPVIIDTDVGTDFDDSVAIALAVASPELDVKLIVSATDDTTGRAKIVAKYLDAVGRTDVAVGIGILTQNVTGHALFGWAEAYDLAHYPGAVYSDGVGAMIDVIRNSSEQVTILAIAPATNFPSLLSRWPGVVDKARIVAMSGSIHRGYFNSSTPCAEYNVATCPGCTRAMYTAGWPVQITPLDTCGVAQVTGTAYDTFLSGTAPIDVTLVECYTFWCVHSGFDPRGGKSDIWFDSVAAYMTLPPRGFLMFESINVTVTSDGHTVITPDGAPLRAALNWAGDGLAQYETWIANRLAGAKEQ